MFTFALVLFAGHRHFSLHIQHFSAFRGKRRRNYQEIIYNENQWPQNYYYIEVRRRVSNWSLCLPYSILFIFPKENAFENLEENLWTIGRKTEFPDFSLTLTISKIFPNFLKDSLTFPELENFRFPWLFPDRGNPEFYSGGKDERLRPFVKLTYSFF